MSKFDDTLKTFYAPNRQAWREWLKMNHRASAGIWLLYYKVRSQQPSIQYSEAVQEALCFGWIDSKVKSIDAERYQQVFTPRKPKSVWSKLNKSYVQDLIEQGLMTQAGLEMINRAKEDGSWTSLDQIEALIVPADLQQALATNALTNQNFQALSNSAKKNILFWIDSAKRAETRQKRIVQTVNAMALNQNP
ncbi:YdeI/OmpD-associated family protein [Thermosynechococcaceae cyanobacterium BACA0444]|uniref:YdeI/OmpD-associated family protein n=1 Tax=Pseudocalidococcus azoricus BACA0444 TaxID=2918990 RepID=A0AAE4FR40_9CYAN|nr:YdeI/OmpD-associated family protein [Pseudocalidococcus azoricus]MDS3860213.1 YdeI/OmpD-associated family protein [Pseudocalidococcus azoricus BACA0444]